MSKNSLRSNPGPPKSEALWGGTVAFAAEISLGNIENLSRSHSRTYFFVLQNIYILINSHNSKKSSP